MVDHAQRYWQYQYDVMWYFIPLLRRWGVRLRDVLDIGCGEGGAVCALHDAGASCFGFDNDGQRIEAALRLRGWRSVGFACWDVQHDIEFRPRQYDLVILHDVIEHLHNKEGVLEKIREFVRPNGRVLVTFPPWYSAYGGHQQHSTCSLHRLPFAHFVPGVPRLIPGRMTMRAFERLVRWAGMQIVERRSYLVSPNHIRYGLRPVSAGILGRIPWVREVFCSGAAYLLSINVNN